MVRREKYENTTKIYLIHRISCSPSFSMGENSNFLILESLLKMSPHCRHIRAYTTRIYALSYANHICNGIFPLVCSGHFICLAKILGRGVLITFVITLSVAVEIYYLGSYQTKRFGRVFLVIMGDQESIQSSITPYQYTTWESDKTHLSRDM